ncbi:hypothetical protein A0H81_00997 [Grifola frondosa]|uniref:Uncharacterized protein n=1 Tax=Grifola frondosa TaxID=5627 RepID=A0A1C7MS64_GRIFR|nr:hypothetical protein A0H81_00997 [Grifola frondosa]
MRKAKDALVALDKYLDKNGVPSVTASFTPFVEERTALSDSAATSARSTHALITHPPITSRNNYISQKTRLLDALYSGTYAESSGSYAEPQKDLGRTALYHTNDAVLARLKKIDEMAAEKGLEVGPATRRRRRIRVVSPPSTIWLSAVA